MTLTAAHPTMSVSDEEDESDTASRQIEIEGPIADGPYVEMADAQWTARCVGPDGEVLATRTGAGCRLDIAGADGITAFSLALRAPVEHPPASAVALADDIPFMVVADTHGEFGILISLLTAQGIIDAELNWTFGVGHVVILGDLVDRGAYQVELLWFLYKLEAEAELAGGMLHVLLGNHEALLLRGDKRYLHPRYERIAAILGKEAYADLFGAEQLLGQWLRTRNTILKLGDNLFVHGGLSPTLMEQGHDIDAINANVRSNLALPHQSPPSIEDLSAHRDGPLWYRGYFLRKDKRTSDADIDRSLECFGVSRIFVGHTPVDRVKTKYGGRVIAAHVYPERHKESGAALIEGVLRLNGRLLRVGAAGERQPLRRIRPA